MYISETLAAMFLERLSRMRLRSAANSLLAAYPSGSFRSVKPSLANNILKASRYASDDSTRTEFPPAWRICLFLPIQFESEEETGTTCSEELKMS